MNSIKFTQQECSYILSIPELWELRRLEEHFKEEYILDDGSNPYSWSGIYTMSDYFVEKLLFFCKLEELTKKIQWHVDMSVQGKFWNPDPTNTLDNRAVA